MNFPQSSCKTRQEENPNSVTARVLHKSELKVFGNKMKKNIIEFLLFDGNNYIEAIAFREIAKDMDKRLEKDRVYCLSGFKMKHSSTSSAVTKLEFSPTTRSYIVSDDIIVNRCSRKLHINEVIKDCRAMQKISVGPVIVTSVAPSRRPSIKGKFLKEILFKDNTGQIIMNIWSNHENIDFPYQRGDVLDLENVEVGVFSANCNPDVFITSKEYSKFLHIPLQFMKELLANEDADELIPVEMTIKELTKLSVNRRNVIIEKASIEAIAKENREMTFMNCNIFPSHGKLEKRDGIECYCKQCNDFVIGEKMVVLDVEIVDESEKTIWVKLYNQASREVLGDENYQKFLKYGPVQQKKILSEVEKNNVEYKFEICYRKGKVKIVKKIMKIQNS